MIVLRVDFSGVQLEQTGEEQLHFSPASGVLAALQQYDPGEPVFLVFPAARQIPSSSILPLERTILHKLSLAIAYLPDLNRMAWELADGLLSCIPEQRLWIGFDDHLFRNIPVANKYYPIPYALAVGYPRHGNDGLVHEWAIRKARESNKLASTITVFLNQRPTLCVFRHGNPVDMSTGYSPVDGLPGDQSSGTIDPSLPMMMARDGRSTGEIRWLLAGKSGWQTIHYPEPIRLRSILKAIGALAASVGDFKSLVFFGEPAASNQFLAKVVCAHLHPFGLSTPEKDLPSNNGIIPLTSPGSEIKAFWIPETIPNIFQDLIHLTTNH